MVIGYWRNRKCVLRKDEVLGSKPKYSIFVCAVNLGLRCEKTITGRKADAKIIYLSEILTHAP